MEVLYNREKVHTDQIPHSNHALFQIHIAAILLVFRADPPHPFYLQCYPVRSCTKDMPFQYGTIRC